MKIKTSLLDPLTGLKGIISLFITYGHFLMFYLTEEDSVRYKFCLAEFFQGVTLFFIISGFTMANVHGDMRKLSSWGGKLKFWKRRFSRLAPLYYVTLAIRFPLFVAYSSSQPWVFWPTLIFVPSMTQSIFGPTSTLTFHSPVWQVSALVLCYVFCPCLFPSLKSCKPMTLWILLGACWLYPIAATTAAMVWYGPGRAAQFTHMFFPVRAPHFFSGVILALLFKPVPSKQSEGAWGKWDLVADLGSLFLAGTQVATGKLAALDDRFWFGFMTFCEYLLLPLHLSWLVAIVRGKRSLTHRFLISKFTMKLGEISYAIYCTHLSVMSWYTWFVFGRLPLMTSRFQIEGFFNLSLFNAAWMIPLCLLVGLIVFEMVEKPCRIRFLSA